MIDLKHLLYYLILFVLALQIVNCSKEADTEEPALKGLKINGSELPTTVYIGDTMRIWVTAEDNNALDYFRPQVGQWDINMTVKLEGNQSEGEKSFHLPVGTDAGTFSLDYFLADISGNVKKGTAGVLEVSDAKLPKVEASLPPGSFSFSDPISVYGLVTDDQDIGQIQIKIWAPDYAGQPTIADTTIVLPGINDTVYDFQQNGPVVFTVRNVVPRFKYKVIITASDRDGNFTVFETEIIVG